MSPIVPRQPITLAEAVHGLGLSDETIRRDSGRIVARAGIQQDGGWLTIDLNTSPADLAHSSLIRAEAACLAEAARFDQRNGALTLVAALTPVTGMALALAALVAEIETAPLPSDPMAGRAWQPTLTFLQNPPALALTARLDVRAPVRGSAFVPAPAVRGASATLQAAAAGLSLDGEGKTIAAAIALLPQSGPLFAVEAASLLIGLPIGPDPIAAAAQQAQAEAAARLGPTLASAAFPVQVAAHLVRKALDRAAARCLAQMEAGV